MEWFYATGDEKQGPISSEKIAELSREGAITATTLIWRDGMADWVPFSEVSDAVFSRAEADQKTAAAFYDQDGKAEPDSPVKPGASVTVNENGVETAICAHSGKVLPISEMIPYGDQYVTAEHKDAFVQQLMEAGETRQGATTEFGLKPMGFWWRFLGELINALILAIPTALCFAPFIWFGVDSGAFDAIEPDETQAVVIMMLLGLGLVAFLVVHGFYHTWMIAKYQGTVGHMTIGAKVVNPDGSKISGGKSFARWLCRGVLNGVIFIIIFVIIWVVTIAVLSGFLIGAGSPDSADAFATMIPLIILMNYVVAPILGSFPFWICAFDSEKRGLHDYICATRVVLKQEGSA